MLDLLPTEKVNKIGIEINPIARRYCEEKGICCYDSLDKTRDESIDIIVSSSALEHVYNPYDILSIVLRKLRPGGIAIFKVPYEFGEEYEYKPNDDNMHLYTWTPMALGNLFKTVGFYIEEIETITGWWPKDYLELYKEQGDGVFNEFNRLEGLIGNHKSLKIVARKRN